MKLIEQFIVVVAIVLFPAALLAADSAVDGTWKMGNGKLVVNVAHCDGDKICVKIANIAKAYRDDGTLRRDDKNPNPALRSRPVVGLEIINNMVSTGPNTWKGRLYNADDGHTYAAYAKLQSNGLEVKGCWGPFCKTLNFSR